MGLPHSVSVSRASLGSGVKKCKTIRHLLVKRRWGECILLLRTCSPLWSSLSPPHTCVSLVPRASKPLCYQDPAFHQSPFRPAGTVAPIPTSCWSPESKHNCSPPTDPGADARWTQVTRRCLFINHPDKHNLPCSAQATLHRTANSPSGELNTSCTSQTTKTGTWKRQGVPEPATGPEGSSSQAVLTARTLTVVCVCLCVYKIDSSQGALTYSTFSVKG